MEEEPLEKLLHQIADIFKFIEENKGKDFEKNVTPEVTKQLEDLKDLCDQLNEINRNVYQDSGTSVQDLQKIVQNPPSTIETRWKRLFDFSTKLKHDLDKAVLQNTLASEGEGKDPHFDDSKQKKEIIRKRQKRFKQMGDQDWMRL